MWVLRNFLLVLGAAALGAVAGGLLLPYLAAVTLARPRRGQEPGLNWGPAMIAVPCVSCGGLAGAAFGFLTGLRWVNRRE